MLPFGSLNPPLGRSSGSGSSVKLSLGSRVAVVRGLRTRSLARDQKWTVVGLAIRRMPVVSADVVCVGSVTVAPGHLCLR